MEEEEEEEEGGPYLRLHIPHTRSGIVSHTAYGGGGTQRVSELARGGERWHDMAPFDLGSFWRRKHVHRPPLLLLLTHIYIHKGGAPGAGQSYVYQRSSTHKRTMSSVALSG